MKKAMGEYLSKAESIDVLPLRLCNQLPRAVIPSASEGPRTRSQDHTSYFV